MKNIDTSILDKIIIGRVNPHIYAFTTETIPNYLKVGDTYRAVDTRLNEWRNIFPNLVPQYRHSAKIDEDRIFRDYAVHDFLVDTRKRERLEPGKFPDQYYSNEFFQNATVRDVEDAIEDIKDSAKRNDNRYQFYTPDHLPVTYVFKRDKNFPPRNNQQDAIDRFVEAVSSGRNNLLMYAVMRFGKTFTAMCCAEAISARLVVIVSAKADVRLAWKEEVESHKRFSKYVFLDKDSLDARETTISGELSHGKNVAVFLTLQDLQGEEIKTRHKELFERVADLLIIDETHFGARAEEYGKVLKTLSLKAKAFNTEMKGLDASVDGDTIKVLKSKVRLHLSGTPYRILMGDEFSEQDIIASCQFADIVDEQQKWDREHSKDDDTKEWDNPYYGFPQMVRFAFSPNKSALLKLQELRKHGVTYAFSELFRPKSIEKDAAGTFKYFAHEKEILDLFQVIDGCKTDSSLLSFLDYAKISSGKMCRHMVCVLPFRACCDALENLLNRYKKTFLHLSDYEIINIAGVGNEHQYPDTQSVVRKIEECESTGKKTLTLTVNRMLTGCTVKEWDTMLYFKDTASPQEYDQAIFRLQNQYIKVFKNEDGDIVKFNMKPQTLLVDFDPNRMFQLQELKSLFYNVNASERGNDELEKRIERELTISPIIYLNKDRLQEVTPTNIIDVVRQYSKEKSILDEATDVPFDKTLLDIPTIRSLISQINPIDAKKGLEINPNDGENTDLDIPTPATDSSSGPTPVDEDYSVGNTEADGEEDSDKTLAKKLAAYYTRILFFSFLTESETKSLVQVISVIAESDANKRIAQHVGIDRNVLQLIQEKASPFVLTQLDCKIQNINTLGRDTSISPLERAHVAMKKFMRVSDSEVVMPENVASDLINLIPSKDIGKNTVILDLASKQAELACALYRRYGTTIPQIAQNIYSIATSPLTYELTRKIYESLGMPVKNIFNFTTESLLEEDAEEKLQKLQNLHPHIIVAGPPYKEADGGGRGESGTAIYHKFFEIAQNLSPRYIAMFLKANWYSGGRGIGLPEFRAKILADRRMAILHDYPDPTQYIQTPAVLRGGVCSFLWDAKHTGKCTVVNHINGQVFEKKRYLQIADVDIFIRYNEAVELLEEILTTQTEFVGTFVSARNPFDIQSNATIIHDSKGKNSFKVYLPREKYGYIKQTDIPSFASVRPLVDSWKVLVAKASPGDDTIPHSIISSPIISEPGSLCTDSHLIVFHAKSKQEAENFAAYMHTRFFRFMMFLAKNNQNMTRDVFRFVPALKMNRIYTDDQLYEQFGLSARVKTFIENVIKPWHH